MQDDKLHIERIKMLLAQDEEGFSRKEDVLFSIPSTIIYYASFNVRDEVLSLLEFRYKTTIATNRKLLEGHNEQLLSRLRESSLSIIRSNHLYCTEKKYNILVLTDSNITEKIGVVVFRFSDYPPEVLSGFRVRC